ncbi:MAG: hypothetical protein RIR66_257 [Actinomycetota bacterium]|jgi:hypothetical protein
MELTQLEKLRDYVCAELQTDSTINDSQKVIDALMQIPIRDGVLRYLYDNQELRKQSAKNLALLLKKCQENEKAALGTIKAGCHWLDEDVEQTKEALKIALTADPTYSLARLLDVALIHGIPPRVWSDSLAAVSPEQCLSGAA